MPFLVVSLLFLFLFAPPRALGTVGAGEPVNPCWPALEALVDPLSAARREAEQRIVLLLQRSVNGHPEEFDRAMFELIPVLEGFVKSEAGRVPVGERPGPREIDEIVMDTVLATVSGLHGTSAPPPEFLRRVLTMARERTSGALRGRTEFLDEERRNEVLNLRRDRFSFADQLAPEHRDVMRLWSEGSSGGEIARQLGVGLPFVRATLRKSVLLLEQAYLDAGAGVREGYRALVDALPETEREVMRLWLQGYSHAQIAQRRGLDDSRVSAMVPRVERQLRERMRDPLVLHDGLYRDAIELLPDAQRTVMRLHSRGRTTRQIVDANGGSINATANLTRKLDERLREALRNLTQPPEPEERTRFLARLILPPREREALELHESGLENTAVGARMGIAASQAGTLVTRARTAVSRIPGAEAAPPPASVPAERLDFYRRATPYLPEQERGIMELRLQGVGLAAIATRLSITRDRVDNVLRRIEARFNDARPGWRENLTPDLQRRALALAQCSSAQRQVMERHLSGQTLPQIAEALGMSLNVASIHLSRGQRDLAGALARVEP